MIHNRGLTRIQRELVFALESARMKLAVAIASETKSTPPDRWKYYLDTADWARRFTKKLRKADMNLLHDRRDLISALDSLRQIPAQGEALQLCRMLREIVVGLEAESE